MRKILVIGITAIVILVSGCSNVPGCSDSDTIDLIQSMAVDSLKKTTMYSYQFFGTSAEKIAERLSFSLEAIRTESKDEVARKSVCQADFKGDAQGADRQMKAPIVFSIQKTDGGDLYATILEGDFDRVVSGSVELAAAVIRREARDAEQEKRQLPPSQAGVSGLSDAIASTPAAASDAPTDTAQLPIHPSFDCAKASTATEKLICSDAGVASLDADLAKVYKNLLPDYPDRAALKKEQVNWIRTKRDGCSTIDCLKQIYQERLDDLSSTQQYLSKPAEFR